MKKMREKCMAITLGLVLSSPLLAHERGGSSVRGGGHVIEVDGKMELVDIVTKATCNWYSGKEMMVSNPEIGNIIKKVSKLDWYLAIELKREIEYLSWCMTGKPYSVPAHDEDSFIQQLSRGVQQAAFRYNDSAYIDENKFLNLSPSSRAYLVFHEMLHSYLPMDIEMRRFKLMSLVSTIQKVDKGQIRTRQSLHLNLAKNEMSFPLSVGRLDPMRKGLQFLFSSVEEQIEVLLGEDAPEVLLPVKVPRAEDLLPSDFILTNNPLVVIDTAIREVLLSGQMDQVKRVLHEQKYVNTNPVSVAFTIFEELSEGVQQEVLDSVYLARVVQDSEDFLKLMDIKISDGRILGDKNLQLLSEQCDEKLQYLTSLSSPKTCKMPIRIEGLAAFIAKLLSSNNLDVIDQMILNNSSLIAGLKLESAKAKLLLLESAIPREKELALKVLKNLQKAMIRNLSEYIEQRVTANEFNYIKTFINDLKL